MAWFGVLHWPDGPDDEIPSTRQQALERATKWLLAEELGFAAFWLAVARYERGDGSDDLELGGES